MTHPRDNYYGETGNDDGIRPGDTVEPITPHSERVEPVNFPYRGQEQHGVAVQGRPWIPRDADADDWGNSGELEPHVPPVEVVPVRVVNDSTHELRSWRSPVFYVNQRPTAIFGRDDERQKVLITHGGPNNNPVLISDDPACTEAVSYILFQGQSVTVESEMPVYARTFLDETLKLMTVVHYTRG